MAIKCSHPKCSFDVYRSNKCVFHCEKDDWFEINKEGGQDWSKSREQVEYFWEQLQSRFTKLGRYIFNDFIFPVFPKKCIFDNDIYSVSSETDEHTVVNTKVLFEACIFSDMAKFSGFKFEKEVKFDACTFHKGLLLNSCIFEQKLSFPWSSLKNNFSMHRVELRGYVGFENSTQENLELDFIDVFFVDNFFFFSKIPLDSKVNAVKKFYMYESYISDKVTVSFNFEKSQLESFEINNCNNFGTLKLSDIKVNNEVIIKKTNLGKALFINADFEKSKIVLSTNSIVDSIWNNIKWGNKSRIEANRGEFRQLKFAYDKQADYIEANEFYALEMREREKELTSQKCSEDWWVFKIGGCVSNHSQSWLKAFGWILGFGIFMFFWYQWRTDKYILDIDALFDYQRYYSGIVGFFDDFAKFMNPFSKKIDNGSTTGYAVWLLHKVFSSFLIYHFIVSLRRNTKR
jgi:hypothetical protein